MTASYAPTGALAGVIYGKVAGGFSGVVDNRNYNNRAQLTSIAETTGFGPQLTTEMRLGYCYSSAFTLTSGCPNGTAANNSGATTGITNGVYSGETQGPTYDTLNRIASDKTAGTTGSDCWGQSFTIDAVSNLTGMTTTLCSIGSLSVSTDGNNHLTNTSGTYTYDNAGNMTNDGAYAYNYDAENRLTAAAGVNYTYDGDGLRVAKSSGTLYWRGFSGAIITETDASGNVTSDYMYFAGRKIARRDGNGNVFYLYSDALGTIHTITDSNGNACYDASFTPYGQEVLNPRVPDTCGVNYKFAGYERDSETQLDYAFARYYNSRLGRFMSIDPSAGSIAGPQSLNRYAYVGNDPLNAVDPGGTVSLPHPQEWWLSIGGGTEFGSGWNEFYMLEAMLEPSSVEGLKPLEVADPIWVLHLLQGTFLGPDGPPDISNLTGPARVPPPPPGFKQCIEEALLEVVAHGEGMDNEPNDGYGTLVGGTVVQAPAQFQDLIGTVNAHIDDPENLEGHPGILVRVGHDRNGHVLMSTAFGRYQIISGTASSMGFTDFSPRGQDDAGIALLEWYDAVEPAMQGDFQQAMWNAGVAWASMPDSPYAQRHITMEDAQGSYQNALNTLPDCQ